MPRHHAITTADIAKHLGISKSTVTHVLNGRGQAQRIAPDTQTRVLTAAQELGYRPNAIARSMGSGRFNSIGLIQTSVNQPVEHDFFCSISRELQARDLSLVVGALPATEQLGEVPLPRMLREVMVDGVLLDTSGSTHTELFRSIRQLGTPVIWVNQLQAMNAIFVDEFAAGRLAALHLLELGHTAIRYVTTDASRNSSSERIKGFRDALESHGFPAHIEELEAEPASPQLAAGRLRQLLRQSSRPTALILDSREVATSVLLMATEFGIRLPQQLSLISMASEGTTGWGFNLTRVTHDKGTLGKRAVEMLLQRVKNPSLELGPRSIAPVLIPGESTITAKLPLNLLPLKFSRD